MSKSIYEDALEKLNEVLLVNKKTTFTLASPISLQIESDNFIYQALKQAQKQEQILNKIKEIINRDYDSYIVSMSEEPKRYDEIVKLIKELFIKC